MHPNPIPMDVGMECTDWYSLDQLLQSGKFRKSSSKAHRLSGEGWFLQRKTEYYGHNIWTLCDQNNQCLPQNKNLGRAKGHWGRLVFFCFFFCFVFICHSAEMYWSLPSGWLGHWLVHSPLLLRSYPCILCHCSFQLVCLPKLSTGSTAALDLSLQD